MRTGRYRYCNEQKRQDHFDLLLAAAVLSVGALLLQKKQTPSPVARITLDGELLQEIPLDEVEESYSFTVDSEGGSNTVLVEPGRIRVSEADCPDQVCVNQGFISDGTVPVVCLPHKLMIEIVGGGSEFDAAAG